MKNLYLLLLSPLVLSCTNENKYTYTIVYDEGLPQYMESEPKEIIAENDSLAYLEAYKQYVINQRISIEMKEQFPDTYNKEPKNFLLYNNEDKFIDTPEGLKGQDSIFRSIEERL